MEKANIETNIAKTLSTYAYIETGKYDKALQLAKETNSLYQQARIYVDTKDLDNAKKTVEKIFSTKKNAPNAYLYVAEIQLLEGHPKSALQSIDKLLTINPKHVEALEVKAKIYESLGQKIKAEVHYLKAKQIKDERRQKGY
jgi:Tfp pilus assembly protein PilF